MVQAVSPNVVLVLSKTKQTSVIIVPHPVRLAPVSNLVRHAMTVTGYREISARAPATSGSTRTRALNRAYPVTQHVVAVVVLVSVNVRLVMMASS